MDNMAGSSPYQEKSANVHQPDDFLELERKRGKETLYIDRGLERHKVNPSPVRKSIFTEGNAEAPLTKE